MDQSRSAGLAETFGVVRRGSALGRIPEQKPPARDYAQARLEERVEAIAAVDRAILEGGRSDALLRAIAQQARRLAGADVALVLLPDESGALAARASDGGDAEVVTNLPQPADQGLARAVMEDGEIRRVADVSEEPSARTDLARAAGLGPAVFVPLKVRAHVVGVVLVADHHGSPPFPDHAVDTVRLFVAQICLAVDTHLSGAAVLLDAVSLQTRNASVRRELERIAPEPVETGNLLRRALDRLARTVVELSEVMACSIELVDGDVGLRTGGSFGLNEELLSAMRAADRRGTAHPAREAIVSGRSVTVTNERDRLLADSLLRPAHGFLHEVAWDAVECLPLGTRGGNRGAVCYYFAPERRPDETCLRLIRAMAAQAAIVVDNAQLLAAANKTVALEERQHLARELHDSVSQALYGIALGARAALERLDQDPRGAREPVSYVLQLAETGLAEMRALIFELRPESLRAEGLAAALVKQADAARGRSGTAVDVSIDDIPDSAIEAQQALYRIGQEALHNAAKHARAQHVQLRLAVEDDHLTLDVTDDGQGFDPEAAYPGHLGLQSMRERAVAAGGNLWISSSKGTGTRVRATVPCFPDPGHRGG